MEISEEQTESIMKVADEMGASVVILELQRTTDGKQFSAFALATEATAEDGEAVALHQTEGMGIGLRSFTVIQP